MGRLVAFAKWWQRASIVWRAFPPAWLYIAGLPLAFGALAPLSAGHVIAYYGAWGIVALLCVFGLLLEWTKKYEDAVGRPHPTLALLATIWKGITLFSIVGAVVIAVVVLTGAIHLFPGPSIEIGPPQVTSTPVGAKMRVRIQYGVINIRGPGTVKIGTCWSHFSWFSIEYAHFCWRRAKSKDATRLFVL